ncbi:MAG: DUF6786 family protein [Promethearchaeia archaeon]
MNYFSKQDLIDKIGKSTTLIELDSDQGGQVVISEYGGRPLGFFPRKDGKSLLWIDPNIRKAIETKSRLIGGDRFWISPEQDYFYKDPENWKNWFCPKGLDPADYQVLGQRDNMCTLSTKLFIKNQRTDETLTGEITREFSVIADPKDTGLDYCGLQYIDDCVIYKPDQKINGWSLANVISGGVSNPGTVLIPTKQKAKPLSYFRTIPQERLHITENYVAYKIDVQDIYKLAIRPEDIDYSRKSKIGYVIKMPESKEYGFLVKRSEDIPESQEKCWDVARDHPREEIGVIQSYNSESPNDPQLRYGEIELQLAPFETIDNTSHGKAIHELLAYMGTKEEVTNLIKDYLGIEEPHFF